MNKGYKVMEPLADHQSSLFLLTCYETLKRSKMVRRVSLHNLFKVILSTLDVEDALQARETLQLQTTGIKQKSENEQWLRDHFHLLLTEKPLAENSRSHWCRKADLQPAMYLNGSMDWMRYAFLRIEPAEVAFALPASQLKAFRAVPKASWCSSWDTALSSMRMASYQAFSAIVTGFYAIYCLSVFIQRISCFTTTT